MIKILCNVDISNEAKKEIQQKLNAGITVKEIVEDSNINILF